VQDRPFAETQGPRPEDDLSSLLSPELAALREELDKIVAMEDFVIDRRVKLLVRFQELVQLARDEDGVGRDDPRAAIYLRRYAELIGLVQADPATE
jgi:hypothetical protein